MTRRRTANATLQARVHTASSDVDETATSLVAAIRALRKVRNVAPGLAKLPQISAARWTQLDVPEPKRHDIAVNKQASAAGPFTTVRQNDTAPPPATGDRPHRHGRRRAVGPGT